MASIVQIKWEFDYQVDGGVRVALSNPALQVDSYAVIKVGIADKATVTVDLQPVGGGKISFIVISSDQYGDALTYVVDPDKTARELNAPHTFVGTGAVTFMNSTGNPQTANFSNNLGKDVQLQIVVGRL